MPLNMYRKGENRQKRLEAVFLLEHIRTFPSSPTDEQIAYHLKHITYARIDNWIDTDFLTWGWCLQLILFLLSLFVWWKLVDKKRLMEITFLGFLMMTVVIWLDQVGYELGMWYYPIDLIPVFPPATTIDYVMLPVIYSLIYQFFPAWTSFLAVICLLSGIFCFILEPLLKILGFYVLIEWKYYYGFPIYIALGIVFKSVIEKIKKISESAM